MIPPVLIEIARNMYGAGAGLAHPSAISAAIFGAMWHESWQSALQAGQQAYNSGSSNDDVAKAFRDALANGLGWSSAEMDEFWNNPDYTFNASDAQEFDANWDAFFDYVEHHRSGGR
ncbi:MAG: hypothetical protein KAY59_05535 [Acidobacteria bacterium]|nr:hypothetical protein [Acidobacteriota bacterium]